MLFLVAAALAQDPTPVSAEGWTLESFELPSVAKPLHVGDPWQARINTVRRRDPDGTVQNWRLSDNATSSSLALTFVVTGLPEGATFDPETRVFRFTPRHRDLGHNLVQVTLTYGGGQSTQALDLRVADDPGTWLMPGAGYTFYAPDHAEMFHGASIEYVLCRFVQSQRHLPGRERLYGRLDLLTPLAGGRDPLLFYALGVGLSFERSPSRAWLVPTFGLEVGGVSGKSVRTAFLSPQASVYVYATRALTVGLDGSWVLPMKFERFDDWMGFRGRAFLDVSLW